MLSMLEQKINFFLQEWESALQDHHKQLQLFWDKGTQKMQFRHYAIKFISCFFFP